MTSPPGGGVTVLDARLTSSNGTTITGIEGSPTGTDLLGTFTDANQFATVADFTTGAGSVVVNWGDGSAPQTLAAADLTAIGSPDGVIFSDQRLAHLPYDGDLRVHGHGHRRRRRRHHLLRIGDHHQCGAQGLIPAESSPPSTRSKPASSRSQRLHRPSSMVRSRRSPISIPTSTIAEFTATIDWGDGTPPTAGTVSQPGGVGATYLISGSHTYADSGVNGGTGTYSIQVFIVDDNGARLTVANTANVADRPIPLAGVLNPASDSGKFNNDAITNVAQPNFYGTSEAVFARCLCSPTAATSARPRRGAMGPGTSPATIWPTAAYAITATAD